MAQPTILIIFGISGDLSQRMLLPALAEIAASNALPEQFRIVGITRRPLDLHNLMPSGNDWLPNHTDLLQIDTDAAEGYEQLAAHLEQLEENMDDDVQRLYYLSVPPAAVGGIIEHLGASGLSRAPRTKLLLEKPFGTDLASAKELVAHIHQHLDESQIYRIDHFLAKEMAQNLVVFRAANSLFRRTWNHEFIERITITAPEHIDIEGRAHFYEQTGALRDFVQNHLLQLTALTLMELPSLEQPAELPGRRLEALQSLTELRDVTRGQYAGYRDEVDNQESSVETFVRMTFSSTLPRWQGVPITVQTGKALSETYTEIRIHYRQEHAREANELVLRIQPNEGISLALWVKRPGYDREFEEHTLSFNYDQHYTKLPKAYERVFVDAMRGDHSLFATSDEVLASWQALQPVLDSWAAGSELVTYAKGQDILEL